MIERKTHTVSKNKVLTDYLWKEKELLKNQRTHFGNLNASTWHQLPT